jgi:hypothetical protein
VCVSIRATSLPGPSFVHVWSSVCCLFLHLPLPSVRILGQAHPRYKRSVAYFIAYLLSYLAKLWPQNGIHSALICFSRFLCIEHWNVWFNSTKSSEISRKACLETAEILYRKPFLDSKCAFMVMPGLQPPCNRDGQAWKRSKCCIQSTTVLKDAKTWVLTNIIDQCNNFGSPCFRSSYYKKQ